MPENDANVAGSTPQAGGTTAGQAPTPPTGNPPTAQAAGTDHSPASPTDDIAALRRELEATRKEAAAHRTKLKTFEDAQAAAEAAQLSEAQKLAKRAEAAEAAAKQYRAKVIDYEVRLQAQALKIVDPELAALAVQPKLEFDDAGNPTNAEALLKDLVKAKPWLLEQAATGNQRPPASSGGATNPGAGARNGAITLSSYKAMSPQERIARNAEVQAILRQNGGRLPE